MTDATTKNSATEGQCHSTSAQIAHSRSSRPVYTPDQVDAYLRHIGMPETQFASAVRSQPSFARGKEHGLPFIEALMRCHLTKIPFENLSLHYSKNPHATLDPGELFDRMVADPKGRGGHCMQMNGLVGNMLRSIGFEVMSTAARTNTACQAVAMAPNYPGPSYNPWLVSIF
jgi:hypothetical protein